MRCISRMDGLVGRLSDWYWHPFHIYIYLYYIIYGKKYTYIQTQTQTNTSIQLHIYIYVLFYRIFLDLTKNTSLPYELIMVFHVYLLLYLYYARLSYFVGSLEMKFKGIQFFFLVSSFEDLFLYIYTYIHIFYNSIYG